MDKRITVNADPVRGSIPHDPNAQFCKCRDCFTRRLHEAALNRSFLPEYMFHPCGFLQGDIIA